MPIQVVELTNIPAELRATAYAPDMTNQKAILERNIYRDEDSVIRLDFLQKDFETISNENYSIKRQKKRHTTDMAPGI